MTIEKDTKLSGGQVNYYLVEVTHPNRNVPPYQAECEDITNALGMNPNEFCIQKAMWRFANQRKHGRGKPGADPFGIYDAEKMVHYAKLELKRRKLEKEAWEREELEKKQAADKPSALKDLPEKTSLLNSSRVEPGVGTMLHNKSLDEKCVGIDSNGPPMEARVNMELATVFSRYEMPGKVVVVDKHNNRKTFYPENTEAKVRASEPTQPSVKHVYDQVALPDRIIVHTLNGEQCVFFKG